VTAPAEAPAPQPTEIRALTGLRILAALWVVFFHFSFTPGLATEWFWRPFMPEIARGDLGVDLFYVLSGFVITLTYLTKLGPRPGGRAAVGFWWARICRIWPVYATVTTLFGGWLLFKAAHSAPGTMIAYQTVQPVVDVWHYLEQLAMVQLWHRPYLDGSSWVGPAWSISAEWLAYVCFPALALLLWRVRRAHPAVTGVLAVAAMVPFAWLCWTTGNPYHAWSWLLRIGFGFTSGALTYLTVSRIRRTRRLEWIAAAVATVCIAGAVVVLWATSHRLPPGEYGGIVVLLFPVVVGSLALSSKGPSRVLSTRPAVHGGRISYSLYLIHVPVFEILWTAMAHFPGIGPGTTWYRVVVPAAFLAALLAAHLSYTLLEEPARMALRARGPGRWARGRRAAARVVTAEGPGDTMPARAGDG
jgi:peptidoglycan/LPS O-acetylase OafA/YrhL